MPKKQDIIKHMLATIGQSGVNTTYTSHPSVQNALAVLDGEDTEFQEKGWWFNSERDVVFVQNEDGEIILPAETLKFYVNNNLFKSPYEKNRYSLRNSKLYDTYRHTFNIGKSVPISLALKYEIDTLPSVAQTYLKHKAAETLFLNEDGDEVKYRRLVSKAAVAWHYVVAEQLQMAGTNALDTPMAQQLQAGQRPAFGSRNPNLIGGRLR